MRIKYNEDPYFILCSVFHFFIVEIQQFYNLFSPNTCLIIMVYMISNRILFTKTLLHLGM